MSKISSQEEFKNFLSSRNGIIFYGASWCGACRMIKPLYERIARRYGDKIKMVYMDVKDADHKFNSIPVLVFYHKGKMVNSVVGPDSETMKHFIKKAMKK